MTLRKTLALTTTAAALALAPLAPALAQDTMMEEGTAPDAAMAVTDEKVTAFVMAAMDVNEIAIAYQPRIETAADSAAAETLTEEARVAMVDAVEAAEGITVDEYMMIMSAARTDDTLGARLQNRFDEMTEPTQ